MATYNINTKNYFPPYEFYVQLIDIIVQEIAQYTVELVIVKWPYSYCNISNLSK